MMKKFAFAFVLIFVVCFMNFASCDINDSVNTTNFSENTTNVTNVTIPVIKDIDVINVVPKDFKIGDVQFNIQVKNNKNASVSDVSGFITGSGFSTYNIIPVDSLNPGERGYIVVMANFRQAGNITLTIKIGQDSFYQNVSVIDSENNQKVEDDLKKEQERQAILANISVQLADLKQNYSLLEDLIAEKKEDNYDVSGISLSDLKSYIRNTETSVLSENADSAKVNFRLASDEYIDVKNRINNAKEIPRINKIKEYALIFSTIAGAFIMFFTVYELLKKKSSAVAEQVHHVKEKIGKHEDKK